MSVQPMAGPGAPVVPSANPDPQLAAGVPPAAEVTAVTENIHELENTIASLQQQVADLAAQQAQPVRPANLSPEQLQEMYHLDPEHTELGAPVLNAAAHMASVEIAKQSRAMQQKFEEQLLAVREQAFFDQLRIAVPNYAAQNNDPSFIDWVRRSNLQNRLVQARNALDVVGVVEIFRGYQTALAQVSQVAPQPQYPQYPPQYQGFPPNTPPASVDEQPPMAPTVPRYNLPGAPGSQVGVQPAVRPTGAPQPAVYPKSRVDAFFNQRQQGLHRTAEGEQWAREYNRAAAEGRIVPG